MNPRIKALLISVGVLALPILIAYPAMYFANFGPCGPTNGWSLVIWGASGLGAAGLSFHLLRETHEEGKVDWISFLRFPAWTCAAGFVLLSGFILLFGLPSLIFDVLSHFWWFFLFSTIAFVGFMLWVKRAREASPARQT
jgi:cytochrome bd-type quinol oxidase subunit 2